MKSLPIYLLLATSLISHASPATVKMLKDLRWKNRVILVHQTERSTEATMNLERQKAKFEPEWKERDILFLTAGPDIRKLFKIDETTFTIVLLGKDGSEKSRQMVQPDLLQFFTAIDGMPMRRREMQKP